jgi:hypothetical protein
MVLVYFGGEEEGVVVGVEDPRRAPSSMVPAAEESWEQEDIEVDRYTNLIAVGKIYGGEGTVPLCSTQAVV